MNLAVLVPWANHLWQSTLFAMAAWLLALLLRRNGAAVRYRIWLAASAKFLIPFALLATLGGLIPWRAHRPAVAEPVAAVAVQIGQPFEFDSNPGRIGGGAAPEMAAVTLGQRRPAPEKTWPILALLLGGAWLSGFIYNLVRWLRNWMYLRRTRQTARPLPDVVAAALPIPVLSTGERLEPGLFGIWRPVLLVPGSIAERLQTAQLETIFAHEICHWRRRDNLTALLHMAVETVFWFYPPVWWIGRRLAAERERACDEAVLSAGNDPAAYAEGILQVCRHYLESPLPCAAGVTGADLKQRIVAILANRNSRRLGWSKKILLGAAGLAAITLPLAAGLNLARPTTPAAGAFALSRPTFIPSPAIAIRPAHPPLDAHPGEALLPAAQSDLVAPAPVQDPSPLPKFAVVNIRAGGPRAPFVNHILAGGQVAFANETMLTIVATAYGVDPETVVGGPSWLDSDTFDIYASTSAPAAPPVPPETLQLMLRSVLSDHFGLVIHQETRPLPAWALELGDGKPQLKLAPLGGDASGCRPRWVAADSQYNVVCQGTTMTGLANFLSDYSNAKDYLKDSVSDSTGLSGAYDFSFKFKLLASLLRPPEPAFNPDTDLSLFDAIGKQLGLKLERKTLPKSVLVVDRVTQQPTGNLGLPSDLPPLPTTFEVASVRPTKPGAAPVADRYLPGGEVEFHDISLRLLIDMSGYGVEGVMDDGQRISGAPPWLDSDHYDIMAKVGTPLAELRFDRIASGKLGFIARPAYADMVRSLIEARFKLQVHQAQQAIDVYALTLQTGGLKFKSSDPAGRSGCTMTLLAGLARTFACQNTTMAQFAKQLNSMGPLRGWLGLNNSDGHYAVDLTGLPDSGYDFGFTFDAAGKVKTAGAAAAGDQPPAPVAVTSLFQALEPLGLKLAIQKHPMPVLVIDHIERTPTPD